MKSIFQIIMLSLVLTSTCSVEPTIIPNDPFITGFQDALKQVGSTTGMTQWNRDVKSATKQNKTQLFLSDNSFKKVNVQTYTGHFQNGNTSASGLGNVTYTTYDNEIVTKYAIEGDLVIKNDFITLTEPGSTQTIATKMKNKGFDTIYHMIIKTENTWTSSKVGGSGTWRRVTHADVTEYYLVNNKSNPLQMIRIYYKASDNTYYTTSPLDDNALNNIHLSYTL